MTFVLRSQDVVINNGNKTVRKVFVKDGKGYKTYSKYRGRKHLGTVKKRISVPHMKKIRGGKFVKNLFHDCVNCGQDTPKSK